MLGGTEVTAFEIDNDEYVINQGSNDVDFRVESNGDTHALFVDAGNDKVGIKESSPSCDFVVKQSGSTFTTASQTVALFQRNSTTGHGCKVTILSGNNTAGDLNFGDAEDEDVGKLAYDHSSNAMTFTTNTSERMRIASDGNVAIGNNNPADDTPAIGIQFDVAGNSNASFINIGHTSSAGTADGFVRFVRSNTVIGQIQTNGVSNVQYSTSSDYRLKENIVTEWDATSRLKQLKPSRFNFKEEKDITRDGFIAHEVSSIVPEAIAGEKDAMTKEVLYVEGDEIPEGKKVGDVKKPSQIDPQGIDQSKLVPLLTKALQESIARADALEARIKKLEDG